MRGRILGLFAVGALALTSSATASADETRSTPRRAQAAPRATADDDRRDDVIELDDEAPAREAAERRRVARERARADRNRDRDRARERDRGETVADDDVVATTTTTSAVTDDRRDAGPIRPRDRRIEEGRYVTLAPMFGYGTDGYGIGAGARAGYTFSVPVYVGGNFMYHAGDGRAGYYPSVEVGADIGVGSSVVLRPYGGAGVLFRDRPSGVDASTGLLYPGFAAHYLVPRSPAFVGGDGRVLLPVNGPSSVVVTATTGLAF